MAYSVRWQIPKKVIHIQFSGEVRLEEARSLTLELLKMVEEGQDPVHLITDQSKVSISAINTMGLVDTFSPLLKNTKLGWCLFYGTQHRFIYFITQVISNLSRIKYRQVANLEAGLAFLQEKDHTLSELS